MANSGRKSLFIVLVTLVLRMLALGLRTDHSAITAGDPGPAGRSSACACLGGSHDRHADQAVAPGSIRKGSKGTHSGVVARSASINKQGDVAHLDTISGDPLLVKAAINALEALEIPSLSSSSKPGGSGDYDPGAVHPRRQLDHPSRMSLLAVT
jgi:hypothetical protein